MHHRIWLVLVLWILAATHGGDTPQVIDLEKADSEKLEQVRAEHSNLSQLVSEHASDATRRAQQHAQASAVKVKKLEASVAAREQRDTEAAAAEQLAARARKAATKNFEAVQHLADQKAASENLQIKRSEMERVTQATEEWSNARTDARKAEMRSFRNAEQRVRQTVEQAEHKMHRQIEEAERMHMKSVQEAHSAQLEALTSTSKIEASQKAAAATTKANTLASIRAAASLVPNTAISMVSLEERKLNVQEVAATAAARQEEADSSVHTNSDKQADEAQQRALDARHKIQERQATQVALIEHGFEVSRQNAMDKMNAAKSASLEHQTKELQKLIAARDEKKIGIEKQSVLHLEDIEKTVKLGLADTQAGYEQAQSVAQSELDNAKALAKQEATQATELASEQEKQDIENAQKSKQQKMSEVARSGVEEGADGVLHSRPLVLIQTAEEPQVALTSAELLRQQERERDEDKHKAEQMIAESRESANQMLMSKKVEDLKLAEKAAIDDATEQAGVTTAEAEATELKAQQDADNKYMSIQETAERKYLETKQAIAEKVARLKIQATVKKNEDYNKATKVWENKKREARSEQLSAFKQIESDQHQAQEQIDAEREANENALVAANEEEIKTLQEKKEQQLGVAKQKAESELSQLAQQTLHEQQTLVAQASGATSLENLDVQDP